MKTTWKKLPKILKILIISLSLLLIILGYKKLISLKQQVYLSKRALIVLVESAFMLVPEDIRFYENNKEISQIALSLVFGVKKSELENKDILEIVDIYGEPFVAKLILKSAKGYGKTVFLTDEDATSDKLISSIVKLSQEGYLVDIVLNTHGGETFLVFSNGYVDLSSLYSQLVNKDIRLGFVYQTACYGSNQLGKWQKIGAQVVNGSKDINSYPIFAPDVFMKSWVKGDTFEKAVNDGYRIEILIWKIAGKIVPDIQEWVTPEKNSSSEMIILGNKNLTIKD